MLYRPIAAALCALSLFGCATAKPVEKMSAEEAFSSAPQTAVAPARAAVALPAPKEWAQQFRRDVECEAAARELGPLYGRQTAWKYLTEGCIAKGGFTLLKHLCDNWTDDILSRPEAISLLAGVVGARGGQVKSDLTIIQSKRIPVFDLGSAVNQTAAFKGRYLLVVGVIDQIKDSKGKIELMISEQEAITNQATVMSGDGMRGSVSRSSGSGSAQWNSTGIAGSGKASGSYDRSGSYVSGKMENRLTNAFEETGQELIVRIKKPDPFLRTERPILFLLRFDGLLTKDTLADENEGEEVARRRTAIATLISYHDI